MSLAGFMKQINKANQLLSEKIGGAKGTELDEEFHKMEKKTDVIYKLVDDLRDRTTEFLQPNPASRAKLWTVNNLSKIRGQIKNTPYPQPEGTLGESMSKFGADLGEDTNFGKGLTDMGECLRQLAGIKYALEDNVKQNFLDPLSQLKDNELKDVMHLRKKMENRRLDYDCKKRKQKTGSTLNDEEIRVASEKFDESRSQAEEAMSNLLRNEVEHITHIIGFAEGLLEYHSQCSEILKDVCKQLNERKKLMANSSDLTTLQSRSIKAISQRPESSSASRFYDNGAETSSSLSDNSYIDNHHTSSTITNNNTSSIVHNSTNNNNSNGNNSKQYPSIGFKLPMQQPSSINSSPTKMPSLPPPTQQRSLLINTSNGVSTRKDACCKGIYDFDAESHEELEFKEGDIIKLISRLDDNWFEGECNGRRGRFPVNYVEIIVPLP